MLIQCWHAPSRGSSSNAFGGSTDSSPRPFSYGEDSETADVVKGPSDEQIQCDTSLDWIPDDQSRHVRPDRLLWAQLPGGSDRNHHSTAGVNQRGGQWRDISVDITGNHDHLNSRCTDTRCADTRCADTRCADTRCADTRCADTRCAEPDRGVN
jgi:hypothetical protein